MNELSLVVFGVCGNNPYVLQGQDTSDRFAKAGCLEGAGNSELLEMPLIVQARCFTMQTREK